MFGHRFLGARYFGSRYFGPGVATATTLSPPGFTDAEAFGTPTLAPGAVSLAPTGFADGDAFGAATLSPGAVTLSPTGLADADGFGTARFIPGSVTLVPSGFADADAFGGPVLQAKKKNGQGGGSTPGGVGAAQKYATRLVMDESGLIVALEAQSSVSKTVNTRMALYADAGGLPGALLAQSAVKASVVSGSNVYPLLTPQAVLSDTALWAALHSDGNFNWFLSAGPTSRFNADAFADGPSDPFGASTLSNNKAPVFIVFLEVVALTVSPTGFADADAFGAPTLILAATQDLAAPGFADADAFGSPELRPASASLSVEGFADDDAFGEPVLRSATLLQPQGFADADAFGSPTLAGEASRPVNKALLLKNRQQRARVLANPIGEFRRLLINRQRNRRQLETMDS